MATFQDWARETASFMEKTLADLLPAADTVPTRLHDAMRYSTLGGGKRVRPMLAFAAGEVSGASVDRLKVVASAVEMIHAYSLIHDDLPCMDDDVLRRGRPTCHIEFDEATALLAGDALHSMAFNIVSAHSLTEKSSDQLDLIRLFSEACGSRGMAGGQAIDLASVDRAISLPELEHMHTLKTGALIRAAVMMGAMCGRPLSEIERQKLDHYAKCIGLAFQVVDDILDCESNTEKLGKTAGKDKDANKPTYVSLLGLNPAKQFAEELLRDAHQSLDVFGMSAKRLHELADFIVKRDY
ncbi:MAG: polyprenyl synthetase family protein [Betaproteobacteria bacterium]|jgi:farnesyl diphosphate synthase|nr:geranyl transferase [Betaproteobacteria bacterium UKL13-2]HCG54356.1 geranyl transferase [Betaproteobacteria bacterium]